MPYHAAFAGLNSVTLQSKIKKFFQNVVDLLLQSLTFRV